MRETSRTRIGLFLVGALVLLASTAHAQWPQWGGPRRDFKVPDVRLAASWPEAGPKQIWSREIGDGYSAVVIESGLLVTMVRRDQKEAVIALSASDGSPKWEYEYDAPFSSEMQMEFGPGPHSTPLIADGRVFTVGVTGRLHALDFKTGKVVWSHDLKQQFKSKQLDRGYSASPIAFKNLVLLPVGGEGGRGIMAFDQAGGQVAWSRHDYESSHASPILIRFDDREQVVFFLANELVGINPGDGELLWSAPYKTQFGANICTPLDGGDGLIFCSAAYGSGSSAFQLEKKDGKVAVRELWHKRDIQVHHGNVVLADGTIFGSSGSFGPAFVFGLDLRSGEVAWKQRGLAKATCLLAGDKLVLLDQDGTLALAEPSQKELKILSRCQLLKKEAWTVPTLIDGRLYVRDRSRLMALEVGAL